MEGKMQRAHARTHLGFRLGNQLAMGAVEAWRRINHPNIITLREAFTTKQFGDSCA